MLLDSVNNIAKTRKAIACNQLYDLFYHDYCFRLTNIRILLKFMK